jgi:upstream activation factor subunit UAF30
VWDIAAIAAFLRQNDRGCPRERTCGTGRGLGPVTLPVHASDSAEDAPTGAHAGIGGGLRATGKWRESMPTKTREKKSSGGKANALQKPLQPSEELTAVVGSGPLPRGQVVSKVWEYIRLPNLQNPENRREILADDKLRRVFGKDKVTMFEMSKHLAAHLK